MVKTFVLLIGIVLIYLGATGEYRDFAKVFGLGGAP
jgi:hypothetical protein